MDVFEVLAAPARREILAELGRGNCNVNQIVAALGVNQPAVSKHLKVLKEAGFVSCRESGSLRIYQIESAPFAELAAWMEPYRRLWDRHLDALERHLDARQAQTEQRRKERRDEEGRLSTGRARRGRRAQRR